MQPWTHLQRWWLERQYRTAVYRLWQRVLLEQHPDIGADLHLRDNSVWYYSVLVQQQQLRLALHGYPIPADCQPLMTDIRANMPS